MYSRTSSTWVQDASLLSRRPSAAEIVRPEAQMPRNPASCTTFAERPSCASMRKDSVGDMISRRRAAGRGAGEPTAPECEPRPAGDMVSLKLHLPALPRQWPVLPGADGHAYAASP